MTRDDYESLRAALDAESISYGELAEIEAAFEAIPDEFLELHHPGEPRENAMASDQLDMIEAYYLS